MNRHAEWGSRNAERGELKAEGWRLKGGKIED